MQMEHDLARTWAIVDLNAKVLSPVAEHFANLLDGIGELGPHIWRCADEVGIVLFGAD